MHTSVLLCVEHMMPQRPRCLALQANLLLLGAMTTCAEMIPTVWDAPNFTQKFPTCGEQPRNWHVYHTEQIN